MSRAAAVRARAARGSDPRSGLAPAATPRARRRGALATACFAAGLLAAATLITGCQVEPASGEFDGAGIAPGLRGQVTRFLEASAEAWNGGDLEAFMAGFARAPSTTYVSGGELRVGWDAIREHYAPRFLPGAARDSLRFEDARARPLGQRHALVTARWVLERDGTPVARGPFTLVLVRVEGSWRILHDHTSTAPAEPAEEPDAEGDGPG